MENPLDTMIKGVKEALETNARALAASKIKKYLEKVNNVPLNIAITGESGSGKSSFVNAFRGKDNKDDGAAPTGCVETTMEVKGYPHPKYPNVTLWDLPGIGTTNFPADKYLQHVGFERFDFFIIISATRFKENDVKLALEIRKMGKKFYFARSKTDHNLRDEERRRGFDAKKSLAKIREDCIHGLQNQGVMFPQVFLLSSFDLQLYDFSLLHETLEKELPAHKKDALLFAMPNISLKIINKKKEAFQRKIKYHALTSTVAAAVVVTEELVGVVTQYIVGFDLDSESLQRLADSTRVPLEDLRAVIKSPLALQKITPDLILKLISECADTGALMAAGTVSTNIPIFGIPTTMILSSLTTYRALSTFLDMLVEDAQKVFEKALGLNTRV